LVVSKIKGVQAVVSPPFQRSLVNLNHYARFVLIFWASAFRLSISISFGRSRVNGMITDATAEIPQPSQSHTVGKTKQKHLARPEVQQLLRGGVISFFA